MGAIIAIIEYLPLIVMAGVFLFVVLPMGMLPTAGIVALFSVSAPSRETKEVEVKAPGFLFKGTMRLGLLVLAIIFALIALESHGDRPPSAATTVSTSSPQSNESARRPTEEEIIGYVVKELFLK